MTNSNQVDYKQIMSRILQVRYDDLEEEKRLCEELFKWAKENQDNFALAFSHTYLGDYYIAQNCHKKAGKHLLAAKAIFADQYKETSELSLRLSSLLAIYYEIKTDEQNAIQYHMDALRKARYLNDTASESTILNNLAFAFSSHENYDQALKYYEKAYAIIDKDYKNALLPVLLSNLGSTLLLLYRQSEAKEYFEKCDEVLGNDINETSLRNWCVYYAYIGDEAKTLEKVNQLMSCDDTYNLNRLSSFENYKDLFTAMLQIRNETYAQKFFALMENAVEGCGLDQFQFLEECRIRLTLLFSPENSNEGYFTFYTKHQEIKKRANLSVAEAMKAKISLENAIDQNENLKKEQRQLEREANIDALTQIYNRRYLDKKILKLSKSDKVQNIGVIMVDIDHFKTFNDFYGHQMGDDILKLVAKALEDNCINGIVACRYGGDEFCCVCEDVSENDIENYIINVRNSIQNINSIHGNNLGNDHITLSIGYACELSNLTSPYLLNQLADQALYDVKLSGRNGFARKRVN